MGSVQVYVPLCLEITAQVLSILDALMGLKSLLRMNPTHGYTHNFNISRSTSVSISVFFSMFCREFIIQTDFGIDRSSIVTFKAHSVVSCTIEIRCQKLQRISFVLLGDFHKFFVHSLKWCANFYTQLNGNSSNIFGLLRSKVLKNIYSEIKQI